MCSDTNLRLDWLKKKKIGKSHLSVSLLTHGIAWLSGKCGKLRHWVTLVDGSGWFQTVRGELCQRGPEWSVHSQTGQAGIPSDKPWALFSYDAKGGARRWWCVKLYCPDVFAHAATIAKVERAVAFGNKPFLTCVRRCGHAADTHTHAHVCISRHACVFFLGSIAAPDFYFFFLLEDDCESRRIPRSHSRVSTVDIGEVVTHGSCWVTLLPSARPPS